MRNCRSIRLSLVSFYKGGHRYALFTETEENEKKKNQGPFGEPKKKKRDHVFLGDAYNWGKTLQLI